MDAYNVGRARFWYSAIDMDCILSRVQFQGGLSISILTIRAYSLQKIGAQNRRVFKKVQTSHTHQHFFKRRHLEEKGTPLGHVFP
jgi:hypothetical protein